MGSGRAITVFRGSLAVPVQVVHLPGLPGERSFPATSVNPFLLKKANKSHKRHLVRVTVQRSVNGSAQKEERGSQGQGTGARARLSNLSDLCALAAQERLAACRRLCCEPGSRRPAYGDARLPVLWLLALDARRVNYENRYMSLLRQRIADELTNKHKALGSGSIIVTDDAAATGMKFSRVVGEIAGLETALGIAKMVDDEMSGKPNKGKS